MSGEIEPVSWGDPYDRLYKDGNYASRRSNLALAGYVPGAIVKVGGELERGGTRLPVTGYTIPSLENRDPGFIMSGVGLVLAIDCESDPITNWIMVSLPNRPAGVWFPAVVVYVLS